MDDTELAVKKIIQDGDLQALKQRLNFRNLDDHYQSGWTPLLHACSYGEDLVVEYLLGNGAKADYGFELFTPLMALCNATYCDENKVANCARLLIKHKANLDAADRYKTTALMFACTKGNENLVNILLDAGCDLDKFDNNGSTALHMACMYGHSNIAKLLLNYGAKKNIKDMRGRLPLDVATSKGLDDIVQMLDEPRTPSEKPVTYQRIKTSFEELLTHLPYHNDHSGQHGFHSDVQSLLSGMRMERKLDLILQQNIGLAQFLNIKDAELKEMGLQFSSHRERIITGNKRFISHPWSNCSLPDVNPQNISAVTMMNIVRSLATCVKHLHILWASSLYVSERTMLPTVETKDDKKINDLFEITLQAYRQTNALVKELKLIQQRVDFIEKSDNMRPADLILPKKKEGILTTRRIVLVSAFFALLFWKTKPSRFFKKLPFLSV